MGKLPKARIVGSKEPEKSGILKIVRLLDVGGYAKPAHGLVVTKWENVSFARRSSGFESRSVHLLVKGSTPSVGSQPTRQVDVSRHRLLSRRSQNELAPPLSGVA